MRRPAEAARRAMEMTRHLFLRPAEVEAPGRAASKLGKHSTVGKVWLINTSPQCRSAGNGNENAKLRLSKPKADCQENVDHANIVMESTP
jgi:hypothetical protein